MRLWPKNVEKIRLNVNFQIFAQRIEQYNKIYYTLRVKKFDIHNIYSLYKKQ